MQFQSHLEDNDFEVPNDLEDSGGHVSLGSRVPKCTFADIEAKSETDTAFVNFRRKVSDFLSPSVPHHRNRPFLVRPDDMVIITSICCFRY